jgi:hypothetical protein
MKATPLIALILLISSTLAQAQPKPLDCMTSPPHRLFDFWLGDWQVHTADGTLAGNNRITLAETACAVREQWTSASGTTGQSLNYYNPQTGQWRQLWLDSGYSIIDISGPGSEAQIFMEGSIHYLKSGLSAPFRGKWTPLEDGRVRQFFEQKDTDGQWQTWFEGFYSKTSP